MMAMTDAIRIGVNAAYLDASYGDFRDGPCDCDSAGRLSGSACGSTLSVDARCAGKPQPGSQ